MATMTLSIPEELKQRMDKHPDIKWSDVFRSMILRKVKLFKDLEQRGEL